MSIPIFPVADPAIAWDGAVNQILSSIAMEELALSHILNAGGKKIPYVLRTLSGITRPGRFPWKKCWPSTTACRA